MSLVLLTGTVVRPAEVKQSRAGKPYARLTVKEREGDAATFWNVTLFSESAIAEVEGLRKDDGVSVRGRLEAGLYTPPQGGEPRVSLSVIADAILPLKRPTAKPRAPREKPIAGSTREKVMRSPQAPYDEASGFADEIPF